MHKKIFRRTLMKYKFIFYVVHLISNFSTYFFIAMHECVNSDRKIHLGLLVERISGQLLNAACKFSTKNFLFRFFLHCVHNSEVLVEQDLIFLIFCHKIENHYFQFIHNIKKNTNPTYFIVQLYDRNKSRQKCHFK